MFYIIFDLIDGDISKTFVGTIQQCQTYVENTYGGFGYENNYVMYNISADYGFSVEHLEYENFTDQIPVNIYEEVSRIWNQCKICEICNIGYKIGNNMYCVRCLENYNNKFCEKCKMCVSTDVENSMWYKHTENVYCIDCQINDD